MNASRLARAAAGALLGLGAAWCFVEPHAEPPRVARPVHAWVADRGTSRVLGLDEDWIPARICPVAHPFLLAARSDGGVWVVGALDGSRDGAQELCLIESGSARARAVARVEAARALVCSEKGDAFLLEEPGRLRRFRDDGSGQLLLRRRGARALAVQEGRLAVGCADGWLLVLELAPVPLLRGHQRLPAGIRDLEPAPDGGWWVLCDGHPGRLVRLGVDLRELWGRSWPESSALLCAQREGLWMLDAEEGVVRRFDGGGGLELETTSSLLRDLEDAAALATGNPLLVGAGALVELDERGRALRSQGGFGFLAAVDRWTAW